MEARIYLRTSYHGLRKAEGCYCGILEADTSEGEKTLEETGKDTGTANQIALLGLIKAMEHMRRASDLEIFTDSKYLESGVNRFLDDWIEADFRKQNGEPVKNSILWQRAAELLAPHNINICYILAVRNNEKQTLSMDEYAVKVREVFAPVADMPDAYEKPEVVPVQPENVTEKSETVSEKPESVPKELENVEKTECEVLSGEVVDNEPEEHIPKENHEEKATEEVPVAAGLDKNVLRGYAAAVSASIKKLDRLWESRELEKCLEELTSIRWRIEQIQKNGGNAE